MGQLGAAGAKVEGSPAVDSARRRLVGRLEPPDGPPRSEFDSLSPQPYLGLVRDGRLEGQKPLGQVGTPGAA